MEVLDRLTDAGLGYCEPTNFGPCKDGMSKGAWMLSDHGNWQSAFAECAQRCSGCSGCNFISVSLRQRDCSWYSRCDLDSLQKGLAGFITARYIKNKSSLGEMTGHRASASSHPHTSRARLRRIISEADADIAQLSEQWMPAAQRALVADQLRALDALVAQWPSAARAKQVDSPLLVLGVMSAPVEDAAARRAQMRRALLLERAHGTEKAGFEYRFVLGVRALEGAALAPLQAEQQAAGDLVLLHGAQDGTIHRLTRKVILWLTHAATAFPRARFLGKADMDTFVVWARLKVHLRHAARHEQADWLLMGKIEWVSLLRPEADAPNAAASGAVRTAPGTRVRPLLGASPTRRSVVTSNLHSSSALHSSSGPSGLSGVCGCCASSRTHAELLAEECLRRHRHRVDGPFPFAQVTSRLIAS